ncbi:MAG: hypothetical protein AABY90_08290 [Nitrospirota bacterium]
MRCLDHIDMAVMAGAVNVVASAVFFFAYLGVEGGSLGPPEPATSAAFLQEELSKAINVAVVTPARVTEERERTQVALGTAIRDLTQGKARETTFISDLAKRATAGTQARREFLESVFKLPSDWRGAGFLAKERQAEALAQPELGRMIMAGSQALTSKMAAAEAEYGRALLAATLANDLDIREPAASHATIMAASQAANTLAERIASAPAPEITREPGWGFGSIGDGVALAGLVLGAGALLLLAAGVEMKKHGLTIRTTEAYCETVGKQVEVTMLLSASDYLPYEVTRCSAFNGGPVTCDKHCLTWPMAQAA